MGDKVISESYKSIYLVSIDSFSVDFFFFIVIALFPILLCLVSS